MNFMLLPRYIVCLISHVNNTKSRSTVEFHEINVASKNVGVFIKIESRINSKHIIPFLNNLFFLKTCTHNLKNNVLDLYRNYNIVFRFQRRKRARLFENVANRRQFSRTCSSPFMSLCDDDASLPNVMANDVFEGIYMCDSPNSQKTAHRTRFRCCFFFVYYASIAFLSFISWLHSLCTVRCDECVWIITQKVQNSQIFRYYFCLSHLANMLLSLSCKAFIFTLKFIVVASLVASLRFVHTFYLCGSKEKEKTQHSFTKWNERWAKINTAMWEIKEEIRWLCFV